MSNWYIDTWDARGGRAFASQRKPDDYVISSASAPQATPDDATIFVGPPGFQPELIVNTSVALAAGRAGSFVPRVPAEGAEIAFPSAPAVAEFVRRGFSAGGGARGGGGEGGGGGGVPRLPEGDPLVPIEPLTPEGGSLGLTDYCALFASQISARAVSDTVTDGQEAPQWVPTTGGAAPPCSSRTIGPVVAGAVRLIAQQLLHIPQASATQAIQKWADTVVSLHVAAVELEIWSSLQVTAETYLARAVAHGLRRPLLPPPDGAYAAAAVFRMARMYLNNRHVRDYWPTVVYDHFSYPGLMSGADGGSDLHDRFAPMYSWPLPPDVLPDANGAATVGQLLSRFVASPASFAKARQGIFEIVLFAAAYLGSRIPDRATPAWQTNAASAWLTGSLPRWRFSQRTEALIEQVAMHV